MLGNCAFGGKLLFYEDDAMAKPRRWSCLSVMETANERCINEERRTDRLMKQRALLLCEDKKQIMFRVTSTSEDG